MHMLQSDSDVIQNANLLETYIFQLQLHHALIPLNLQKNPVIQNFSLSKRMIKVRNDPAWHTVTFQACLRGISIPVTESIVFNLPQNPLCPCTNTLMHTYTMTSFFSHTAINLCLAAEIILWRNELDLLVQLQQNKSMSHRLSQLKCSVDVSCEHFQEQVPECFHITAVTRLVKGNDGGEGDWVHCFFPFISTLLDINNQVLPTCKGILISECKRHYTRQMLAACLYKSNGVAFEHS